MKKYTVEDYQSALGNIEFGLVKHKEPPFQPNIDVLQHLVDLRTPKKPNNIHITKVAKWSNYGECPNCGKVLVSAYKNCTDCSQALDWSDSK